MKERPILFSGEMVRAILEGRKTMTRRVIKDPICTNKEIYADAGLTWYGNYGLRKPCPYGEVGDRLWVKEAHYAFGHWERTGIIYPELQCQKEHWKFVHYGHNVVFDAPREFMTSRSKADPSGVRWYKRNSLFMPKWAARTWLERTETKVERLQDITEEDAKAEGVIHDDCSTVLWKNYTNKMSSYDTARSSYASLWEKINGDGSWDSNPWVWVIEFKKVEVAK